eukprot:8252213-Pyramimonas_sp.AAC.1
MCASRDTREQSSPLDYASMLANIATPQQHTASREQSSPRIMRECSPTLQRHIPRHASKTHRGN